MSAPHEGTLHGEHVLLGARFAAHEGAEALHVSSYEREVPVVEALEGAVLSDLTGSPYLFVSGEAAEAFGDAALAGRPLSVGDVAFEAALAGDGSLVSVPLALRTGDTELVLVDPSRRGPVLDGWVRLLAGAEQDGSGVFAGVTVEDASEMLVPLLLVGGEARPVLADYVSTPADLPAAGRVASLHLDAIPAVVAQLPRMGSLPPAFLVLVPPARARALWRSLLSFTTVSPVGAEALCALGERLPWGGLLSGEGPVRAPREELTGWGLMRDG
ncbi:aminomethyl transferase family protein, partial [Olsenella profusa]|nr:aminomethyl transferase family protein [Olsenella profusa]